MITHESVSPKSRHGADSIQPTTPAPLWRTLQADLARFREEGGDTRTLMRGLLSQGFQALVVYRIFRWFHEHGIPAQPIRFFVERLAEIVTGISIPAQAHIGKGLRIHHFGGIIIHSETVIGEGCTLYHGVTLGDRGGWGGASRIGNHVMIGAGAKILKVPRAKGEWTRSALLRFIALLRDQSHVTSRLAPLSLFAFFFRSLDDEANSLCSDEKEEICRALLLALATRTELARWRRN